MSDLALPKRVKQLDQLLEELQKADRVFDYNVPRAIRASFDDKKLLEFLANVYVRDDFVVDGEEEVAKYAKSGDWVVKKGDSAGVLLLSKGAEGIVRRVDMAANKLLVDFSDMQMSVPFSQLTAHGWKGALFKHGFQNEHAILDLIENFDISSEKFNRLLVRYTGEPVYDGRAVPDGTDGILLGAWDHQYYIAWHNAATKAGLKTLTQRNQNGRDYLVGFIPELNYSASAFTLLVPNKVDFAALRQKFLPDGLDE